MNGMTQKKWLRIAVFAVGAIIITYFLPRPDKVSLSYEEGRPWSHPLLLAPFDIPVYRDSVETARVVDSINAHFVPIFKIDETPLEKIRTAINSSDRFSQTDRTIAIASVERLYANGIVGQEIADHIASGKLSEIKVSAGNVTKTIPTDRMRSSRRAYVLLDSLVGMRRPTMMQNLKDIGIASYLTPNYIEDADESARLLGELIQPVKAAIGMYPKGAKIIDRGEIVTPQLYQVLQTYERESEKQSAREGISGLNITIGQVLFSVVVMAALYFYLLLYRREIFDSIPKLLCLVSLIVSFFVFAVFMASSFSSGLYIVPFVILPILLVVFYDTVTAMFALLAEILICSAFASYVFEFVFVEVIAGFVAIFSMRELSRRSQLLRTAALVFAAYVVSYAAVELMQVASLNSFSWKLIGYFAVNMVLTSFAYILIFVVEKLFGFTSVVTLVELSDINNPVLRELSEECPGTFQHSMAVSNLASDAAHRIGANVQLVRAGALYHDIGKIRNPAFFTENQHGVNPHDALSPVQSARVVISHVTDGLKLAEKAKLPKVIRDMIVQHHGLSTARYFLTTYRNAHPDEDVDTEPFTYPGPNPQTKEASLLMMADVVEAASRSLPNHDPETIAGLVNRLVDAQVSEGLHSESPLSFRDITTIKQSFIERLRTMYHVRISYPDAKKS